VRQHQIVRRGDRDYRADHDRMDLVIRPAEPSRIGRGGDDLGRAVSTAVEVDPPQSDHADEPEAEYRHIARADCGQPGQLGAQDDDRLAQHDQDEGVATFGNVHPVDRPFHRVRPTEARHVERDDPAEDVKGDRRGPQPFARVTMDGGPDQGDDPARDAPAQDPLEVSLQRGVSSQGVDGKDRAADLNARVRTGDRPSATAEAVRNRHREHQAGERRREQHQPHRDPIRIEPVRHPHRVRPDLPDQAEQHQGLDRAVDRVRADQVMRKLGDGEDVDQVEEQFGVGHPGPRPASPQQRTLRPRHRASRSAQAQREAPASTCLMTRRILPQVRAPSSFSDQRRSMSSVIRLG
jgi:hypothetical protein